MTFPYFNVGFCCFLLTMPLFAAAQTGANTNGSNYNKSVPTGVPFLTISPDSRSGALGDAGVAITPDANANYWDPAKLAFIEENNTFSLSYSPWLRNLVPDVSLSYLSFAHKLDDRNAFGLSLRYFNLGTIQLTDNEANSQGTYVPNEFSLDGSFARKFGDDFSLGLTFRYIHSNLSDESFATGTSQQTKAGNAVAADVSFFYKKPTLEFGDDALFAFGANISNIGTKISYSNVGDQYFLPTNFKIGAANTVYLDPYNEITLALDLNKLLVAYPPVDANGNIVQTAADNVSVPSSIFQSFSNAPGGLKGELQQVTVSTGLEYWYNKQFAIRAGYFYGNPNAGYSGYVTLGVGLKYEAYAFNFSYLAASQQSSPLANTIRVSLSANFGGTKN